MQKMLCMQNFQTKHTKQNLPNKTCIKTKSNLAYQAYWTKPTKPKLLFKAVNDLVQSAFGNNFLSGFWAESKSWWASIDFVEMFCTGDDDRKVSNFASHFPTSKLFSKVSRCNFTLFKTFRVFLNAKADKNLHFLG